MRKEPSIFPSAGAISIHGAREHNLKNLSLDIPRNQFVVITGVSGSGKSTLAFDLLFAEGQRRFLDNYPSALAGRRSGSRISSPPLLLTRFFSLLQNLLDCGRYYVPYGYAMGKKPFLNSYLFP